MSDKLGGARSGAEPGARGADAPPRLEKIWDPVVRLTHWAIVATVLAGYFIGENMSFSNIAWHFWLGYATGALVLVRLVWGVIGPRPARIAPLFVSPSTALDYARKARERRPSFWPGHNPLGGLSALLLWAVLIAMVGTGLFSESEDLFTAAILSGLVDYDTRVAITGWHQRLHTLVLPLILLHVGAVLFYLFWKKENLIRPMITGWKHVKRPQK
ncbi:MAG: cytochrome b/b6 domain-containing protein [Pseudomonadota bacterium]